jgi:hypothetical protein
MPHLEKKKPPCNAGKAVFSVLVILEKACRFPMGERQKPFGESQGLALCDWQDAPAVQPAQRPALPCQKVPLRPGRLVQAGPPISIVAGTVGTGPDVVGLAD